MYVSSGRTDLVYANIADLTNGWFTLYIDYADVDNVKSVRFSVQPDGGAFTVGTTFSAGTISGFSFLTVEAGSVTVSGSISLTKDGVLNFDLTNVSAGNPDALVNDISLVSGDPSYTLTATGTEAVGSYKLAGNAADFDKTVSVKDTHGTTLGTLTIDQSEKIGEKYFTLGITDAAEVILNREICFLQDFQDFFGFLVEFFGQFINSYIGH